MLDAQNLPDHFNHTKTAFQRGAIIGVDGFPGRTKAGEFTIIAEDYSILAKCPHNLPVMN